MGNRGADFGQMENVQWRYEMNILRGRDWPFYGMWRMERPREHVSADRDSDACSTDRLSTSLSDRSKLSCNLLSSH
jgi:hypothetical protein